MTDRPHSCSSALRGIAAATLAIALAGCVSLTPHHERPRLPVTDAYPDDAPASGEGRRAIDIGWQDYFADPRLQSLIAQALQHNRDLRIAALRVDEARAVHGIQRSGLLPDIGLDVLGTRGRVPGAFTWTGRSEVTSQYEARLGLSNWELDFWGRLRNLRDAALQDFFATEEARRAAVVALIAEVADAYLGMRELDERVAIAAETAESHQESFRIFSRRYELGAASRLELAQVETLLTQAQALHAGLEQARSAQAHALALLVGTDVDLSPGERVVDDGSLLHELRPGLPSELLTVRPDIAAAEHRLLAANADIGAARAAFFPSIALTASFGTASSELDDLFDSGTRSWNFLPSISLPLFRGGRLRASLDLAEVRRDIAVADYERTVQAAFRDVADALSARRWLDAQVDILRRALDAHTDRARLAQLRYDSGAIAYLEVLDARRDLLTAQQELVQARRGVLSAQIRLYAALGGGATGTRPVPPVPAD